MFGSLMGAVLPKTVLAVLGGFAAAFLSGYALCALALHPALQPSESFSASYELGTNPFGRLVLLKGEVEVLVAVLGGYFLGGVVAGRISPAAPGAAGVASAALVATPATAWRWRRCRRS